MVNDPIPNADDVYVYVRTKVLFGRRTEPVTNEAGEVVGERVVDHGRWLTPGSAHQMTAEDATVLVAEHADVIEKAETVSDHHVRSRAAAAVEGGA